MIVKCDAKDCIYNEHGKCDAGTIDIHQYEFMDEGNFFKAFHCETYNTGR